MKIERLNVRYINDRYAERDRNREKEKCSSFKSLQITNSIVSYHENLQRSINHQLICFAVPALINKNGKSLDFPKDLLSKVCDYLVSE